MHQIAHGASNIDRTDPTSDDHRVRWWRVLPALTIHLGCLGIIWVGWSWTAVAIAVALYFIRMFVITAFYHRYFSHRTFRTSRPLQAFAAFVGTTCAQRGPLWWAAHHRDHHRESDDEPDIHSPVQHGVLWSHVGWFLSDRGVRTNWSAIPDLVKFKELVLIDRLHLFGPIVLSALLFLLGEALAAWAPGLGTNGMQLVVWGFFVSTTILYHGTFTINSIAHRIGSRRFATTDDSRNNWFLALITLGEGWHNNHHFNPGCVRQGFYWWEIDVAFYTLWVMERFRLVWDLRPVPQRVYELHHRHGGTAS